MKQKNVISSWFSSHYVRYALLTSYERVLARHQSSSICLMEFALGTPKLVERCTMLTLATAWFPGLKEKPGFAWLYTHALTCVLSHFFPSVSPHPPPSFSSFSIMAFRACMADVLGIVWALISSLRLSACRRSIADKPPLPPRDEVSSSRSNTLRQRSASRSFVKVLKRGIIALFLHWCLMAHLPTFLLVLEDDDEVKLYDFDWTVPPNSTKKFNIKENSKILKFKSTWYSIKVKSYCLFSAHNWSLQLCCVLICSHHLKKREENTQNVDYL